jgi:hypothetical protein
LSIFNSTSVQTYLNIFKKVWTILELNMLNILYCRVK